MMVDDDAHAGMCAYICVCTCVCEGIVFILERKENNAICEDLGES